MTQNRVDGTRPDAPALAARGPHPTGVRTLVLTDPDRVDVLASGEAPVRGPRSLTCELWYPAAPGTPQGGRYETVLRDGVTPVTLHGQARRGATPSGGGPFPLVIVSHGYPGNRYLMAHLCEHLASHGYTVLAPDHSDSTYADQGDPASTLYNRPLDQAFVLRAIAGDAEVSQLADAGRTAVIGYSMGGYGALVFGGAGLVETVMTAPNAPPHGLMAGHVAGSDGHTALPDPRVKALVAIGPWGMTHGLWDARGLAGLRKPLMIMAGSMDHVSGYDGMRAIFEGAVNTDRHLLTFVNAGHNAAAPIPAPAESHAVSERLGWAPFHHYADPVWDTLRMNGIAQHFALAFLDLHLKGMTDRAAYLDLIGDANAGGWAGFGEGNAVGLRFETRCKGA